MLSSEKIVAVARSYIGTPYHHQGRLKSVGVDCMGLVFCVLRELGVPIEDRTDYPRAPIPHWFLERVRAHWPEKPVAERSIGDLLLIAPRNLMQHACILSTPERVIHSAVGRKVEEVTLAPTLGRICHCFDLTRSSYV